MDVLIAELRQRHLAASTRYGADSAPARQLSDALSVAYEHRSGMIYLRPPSAFLRSSYPSSSLQEDPSLGWTNLLGQQAWRGVPGHAILDPLFGLNNERFAEAQAEIDKQFWQNINRVRVAGAGNTNYAVAKDDIGNWYVKSYAADATPILDSAINLGLYSLGTELGQDVLGSVRDPEQGVTTAQSDLDAVRERFETRFGEEVDERAKQVRELFDSSVGVAARVRVALTSDEKIRDGDTDRLKTLNELGDATLESALNHVTAPDGTATGAKYTGSPAERGSKSFWRYVACGTLRTSSTSS